MFKWIKDILDKLINCCRKREDLISLPDLRIYIVVPYSRKDEAKLLGAFWDTEQQKWYALDSTYGQLLSNFKSYESLIFDNEDRNFGGNFLSIDMIPSSCARKNVRSKVSEEVWEMIRYTVRDRSHFTCELCGIRCKVLHCHERFSYNMNTKVQKLERFLCLCADCHNVVHWGRAELMGDGSKAREHLKKIGKMTDEEVDSHIRDSYKLRWERDKIDWELDLSILKDI
jgi:hypothetical protein